MFTFFEIDITSFTGTMDRVNYATKTRITKTTEEAESTVFWRIVLVVSFLYVLYKFFL